MYKGPQPNVPKLNPDELYEHRMRRDKSKLSSYNQILEQIYNRIYCASQMVSHPACLLYTVPPFVFGLPKIDLEDCIVYLVYQLRQSKFEVRFTYPNLLYISWRHHEQNYLLHQNPIIQAMMPPAPPPRSSGSKKKVSFVQQSQAVSQDPFAQFTSRSPVPTAISYASPTSTAPRRTAADYRPPVQFMQQMERPSQTQRKNVLDDLIQFS